MCAEVNDRPRSAYTLIELLLALAVLAVFAAVVLPSFFRSYFEHRVMDKSVSQVMESILAARQLAVQTATPVVYEFTPGSNVQKIYPVSAMDESNRQVIKLPENVHLEIDGKSALSTNRAIFREDGSTEGITLMVVGPTQSQAIQVHRRLGIPQRVASM